MQVRLRSLQVQRRNGRRDQLECCFGREGAIEEKSLRRLCAAALRICAGASPSSASRAGSRPRRSLGNRPPSILPRAPERRHDRLGQMRLIGLIKRIDQRPRQRVDRGLDCLHRHRRKDRRGLSPSNRSSARVGAARPLPQRRPLPTPSAGSAPRIASQREAVALRPASACRGKLASETRWKNSTAALASVGTAPVAR